MKVARVAAILAGLLLLGASPAAEPDKRAIAEELLALTNVEKSVASVRDQMQATIAAQVRSMEIPEGMHASVERYQQQVHDLLAEELSFAKLKPTYLDIYAATFTTDELEGLVAFYKSAAGQAYARKLPALTKQMLEAAQYQMKALAPRLKKMNDDFLAEIKQGPPSR